MGFELRELRKEKGLSLRELARRSGVSHPYLSQLETQKRHPKPDILRKLSKGLNEPYLNLLIMFGDLDTEENIRVEDRIIKSLKEENAELKQKLKQIQELTK